MFRIALAAATGTVLLGAALPASASPGTRTAAARAARWQVDVRLPLDTAQPPNGNPNGATFNDVEAVGPKDAYAVGTRGENLLSAAVSVVRHWHSGRWHTASIPAGWINKLQAVGGSSPTDVWALGAAYHGSGASTTTTIRAVHYNGRRWTRSTVPAGPNSPEITSIASFGSRGAWAVGCYCFASQSPYIARYSNGHWRDVTPNLPGIGGIFTLAVQSRNSIWAAATNYNVASFTMLHWNGKRWARVAAPASLVPGTEFAPGGGIVAQRNGVWLAGWLQVGQTFVAPAILHFTGHKWQLTRLKGGAGLTTLVPDGSGGFWSTSLAFSTSAQFWHFTAGRWRHASGPAGASGLVHITWMAHVPGTRTSLAIGGDSHHELLMSYGAP